MLGAITPRTKYISLISLISGLIGLTAIIYFNYEVDNKYKELSGLVTLFIYGRTNKIVLYFLTSVGLIAGIISTTRISNKYWRVIGLAGLIICILNFIALLLTGL